MRNKPTRFYSKEQEKAVAKEIGGKRQANSGASTWQKGDVQNKHFLIECKTHTKVQKSTTIEREWLDKVREEAFGMRKDHFALCFDFGPNTDRWYIIDAHLFRRLNEMLEEEDNEQ